MWHATVVRLTQTCGQTDTCLYYGYYSITLSGRTFSSFPSNLRGPCENSGEASGHRVRTPQRRCLENLENTPESRQNNVVRNKDVRFIVSVCGQELVSSTFPQPREDPGEAGHWPVVAMIVFPSPVSPGLSLSSESAHCRQMSQMTEHLFIIFKSAVLMIKQWLRNF